jgi:hypothetical protein
MKLVTFSLQKYRSIKRAERLKLGDLTILVGPNNEGKSNILRGLVVGMRVLSLAERTGLVRGRYRTAPYRALRSSESQDYDWERDFPLDLQESSPEGKTIFDFEFELSPVEIGQFKSEVKSSLNGLLPIRLSLGSDVVEFEVKKKGPGGKTLTAKRNPIARFVGGRLQIHYIPSVRTARSAMEVVDDMVGQRLRAVEQSEGYQEALRSIEALQAPVLEELSASIQASLQQFLPQVGNVEIRIPEEGRYAGLRRSQIIVDDGTPTDLQLKGDGVQSLAAISLTRHLSQQMSGDRELILAVEEPEAHLHPRAIHQIRNVLADIAATQQVVVTTHSPLLTNRLDVSSNIIVDRSRARPAKNIKQVRDVLGVRVSDNLAMAQLVLVVEGESDAIAMRALLPDASDSIREAIESGMFAIDLIGGAGNLTYKLSQLSDCLCSYHVFLDNDASARAAATKAELDGLLDASQRTYAMCPDKTESEIEDLYDLDVYASRIKAAYNVDLQDKGFTQSKFRWSDRMKKAFHKSGQPWDDKVSRQVKLDVAHLVDAQPGAALQGGLSGPFDSLVTLVQSRLTAGG